MRRARRRARRVRIAAVVTALLLAGIGAWLVLSTGGGPDPKQRPTAAPVASTTTEPPAPPLQRYWFAGDSVASNLANPMAALAAARGLQWSDAAGIGCRVLEGVPTLPDGTPAGPESCPSIADRAAEGQVDGEHVAVILSSWEVSGLLIDEVAYAYGSPGWEAKTFALWDDALGALASSGVRSVVIVAPAPPADWIAGLTPDGLQYAADVRRYERFLARVAARHADLVTLVRLSSIVCAGGPCPMVVDGVELRPGDGGHLSIDGAQTVAERLIDAVVEAANRVA